MKNIKSILAFFLILGMVSSNIPMYAFAANDLDSDTADQEIIEETQENGEEIRESFSVKIAEGKYEIEPYVKENTYYLFLPNADAFSDVINIQYTGNVADVTNGVLNKNSQSIIIKADNNKEIGVTTVDGGQYKICIMQSDLPSCYITLNGVDLETIHQDKDIKYKGNELLLTSSDSGYDLDESDVEMKGRGNFSWTNVPKKGYQIKFSSKKDVLGMEKSKTWVLIANYGDATLMRNQLLYELASDIGMEYIQQAKWVDLWIDGAYLGNYLLCEKVEVGSTRVDLQNEDGLIAEMDNNYYASEENYFTSEQSGSHFVLKDSVADDEGEADSVSEASFKNFEDRINLFESYLYADTKDWTQISSMIDEESFVKYYFIEELSENADGCRSSMFLYADGKDDVIHMGPVWDFDLALGNCDQDYMGGNTEFDYIMNIQKYMVSSIDWYTQLFQIPEFREIVRAVYQSAIRDCLPGLSSKMDQYSQDIRISSEMNFTRWEVLGKENIYGSNKGHKIKDTWEEEVDYLKMWLEARVDYLNRRYDSDSSIVRIKYQSYLQSKGWENVWNEDKETSGTVGEQLSLEGIKIYIDSFNEKMNLGSNCSYRTYMQTYGWNDWVSEGETSGLPGEGKRMEAIEIKLSDELSQAYDVYYRAQVQTYGWLDWAKNGEPAGTIGYSKRLEGLEIQLVGKGENPPENVSEPNRISMVSYSTHVQTYGWRESVPEGETSGTTGEGKRLEAIKIKLENTGYSGGISYSTHVQSYGWQDWKSDGDIGGTIGKSKRLEAIKIKLTGEIAEEYDVYYRVHAQHFGWLGWAKNGEPSGTEGYGRRLEAIQIRIVKKNDPAPGETENAFYKAEIGYQTHVQSYGWQAYVYDGETAGTTGSAKRLEAIRIKKMDTSIDGSVQYRTHVQTYGWETNWKSDGQLSGTSGESKRLEAIQIRLTGELAEKYDVYYRVHAQTYGWLGWAKNGEEAGTEGLAKRLEAIEIVLVEKDTDAPGDTENAFVKHQSF